jgi:putative PIN family toxin of toxin-antitoxin system
MIVVFDSNVWVSALQFALRRGTPQMAIEKAAREDSIAICSEIEGEILRILTLKFGWSSRNVAVAMNAAYPFPIRSEISGTLHVCRDPNDDMVLECAVLSGAQTIVSGDKDLLALRTYQGIRIITPVQYLSRTN